MSAKGVELTFQILSKTANPAAVSSLISVLDNPHPQIRELAVRSLLSRKEVEGHRAVLVRFPHLPSDLQQLISENRVRLGGAVRELLRSRDMNDALRGIEMAVLLREYEVVPILTHMVLAPDRFPAKLAAKAIFQLAEALAEECSKGSSGPRVPPPESIRRQFLHTLARAVEKFSSHHSPDILLAYLVLADPGESVIGRVLENPSHPAHRRLCEILLESEHPSVIRFLIGLLNRPSIPPVIPRIVSLRDDLGFVKALLSLMVGEIPSQTQRHLSQVRTLRWLEHLEEMLPRLTGSEQVGLTKLAQTCGLRSCEILLLLKCILRKGESPARKAAVVALESVTGPQGNLLFCQALNDPDPEVQALAVRQLRKRGMIGALPKLIELLDSPEPVLRQAAQESLEEFRFDRFAAAFDLLEEEVRRTTGKLVRKADPHALDRLREELQSPSRARRLRAIALAEAMDVVQDTESQLIELAEDPDHMVRLAAIKALGQCNSEAARQALLRAINDRAMVVQQTAQTILAELDGVHSREPVLPNTTS